MRRILLAIMAVTIVGIMAELVLLEHTETWIQWIPLVALAAALVSLAALAVSGHAIVSQGFQLLMAVIIVVGGIGLYFHYRGNVEFALETYPEMRGTELVWEALTGATPTLAPGAMMQLGLLGLALTYTQSARRGRRNKQSESMNENH